MRARIPSLCFFVFLATIFPGSPASAQPFEWTADPPSTGQALGGLENIDRRVMDFMIENGVAGASLTVMNGNRILLARGYGYADVGAEVRVQPNTMFRISVIYRILTAAAIHRLIEQGTLNINQRVLPLLEDLPPFDGYMEDPRFANVSIKHLLEDTSGLGGIQQQNDLIFNVHEAAKIAGVPPPLSCETFIRVSRSVPLHASPGSQQDISNTGYCLLGAIIERVTDMTFEEYIRENLFAPLGITQPRLVGSFLQDRVPGESVYYDPAEELFPSAFVEGELVPGPYGYFALESLKGPWAMSAVDLNRIIASLNGSGPGILAAPPVDYVGYLPPFGNGWLWAFTGLHPGTVAVSALQERVTLTLLLNTAPESLPFANRVTEEIVIPILSRESWPVGTLTSQFTDPAEFPDAVINATYDDQSASNYQKLELPVSGPAMVELNATESLPGEGGITAYRWWNNGEVIGNSSIVTFPVTAPENHITLRITNTAGLQDSAAVDVSLLGNRPMIESVNVAGGGDTIAANTWIEIKGMNLAPEETPAAGVTWSDAPEFAQGIMPTSLDGVSVTVNGDPGYTYFVSRNQVNILTSLEEADGPVEIVITTPEGSSEPFLANFAAFAPALFQIGEGNVAALHLDFSLVGPPSLFPGFTTAAETGETIVLYANGFGQPTTALTEGSATQAGQLPDLPVIKFNGIPGNVSFAGIISPGLYQFNVDVPPGVSGKVEVTVEYQGFTSPPGAFVFVAE